MSISTLSFKLGLSLDSELNSIIISSTGLPMEAFQSFLDSSDYRCTSGLKKEASRVVNRPSGWTIEVSSSVTTPESLPIACQLVIAQIAYILTHCSNSDASKNRRYPFANGFKNSDMKNWLETWNLNPTSGKAINCRTEYVCNNSDMHGTGKPCILFGTVVKTGTNRMEIPCPVCTVTLTGNKEDWNHRSDDNFDSNDGKFDINRFQNKDGTWNTEGMVKLSIKAGTSIEVKFQISEWFFLQALPKTGKGSKAKFMTMKEFRSLNK